MPRLAERFPPGWKRSRSPLVDHLYSLRVGRDSSGTRVRHFNLLYSDAVRVGRSLNLEDVLRTLESDLQMFVAMMTPSRLFVHAGVVGWRGRAILFPGRSFSGKTTLVSAMLRAGAAYYSDEYAVLDSRGRVHPFARPLTVRESAEGSERRVPVEDLGVSIGRKPMPVGFIVQSPFKKGASWRPRRLSPGQAIMSLLANTVAARLRPRFALSTLARAAADVAAIQSFRGEAESAASSILRELDNEESASTERT